MTIHEIQNPIAVHTPLGEGKAIFLLDYGFDVNSVWKVRLVDGSVRNFYDDDIRIFPNPMNGEKPITIPKNWKQLKS